jgi:hypothetical protein
MKSDKIITAGSVIPSMADTPLDARIRVENVSDIYEIEMPYVGMIVYVTNQDKYYKINTLKAKKVGTFDVENALVDTIEELFITKSTVNDLVNQVEDNSSQLAYIKSAIVTPTMFGALGDGVTDDTLALQNAIKYCEKTGAILHGMDKSYLISDIMGKIPTSAGSFRDDYGLYITKNITIKNMKLIVKGGIKLYTSAINIYGGKNTIVNIENVEIDGQKDLQDITPGREDGGKHGIRVYGETGVGIGTVILKNCNIKNCSSDCVMIRDEETVKIHCIDCVFDGAGRNGITDNSNGLSVYDNCIFKNAKNLSPQSGFHIEPDSTSFARDYVFNNCRFENNAGSDFKLHIHSNSEIKNITFNNCIGGDIDFAIYTSSVKNVIVNGGSFGDIKYSINPTSNVDDETLTGFMELSLNNVNSPGTQVTCSSKTMDYAKCTLNIDNCNLRCVYIENKIGTVNILNSTIDNPADRAISCLFSLKNLEEIKIINNKLKGLNTVIDIETQCKKVIIRDNTIISNSTLADCLRIIGVEDIFVSGNYLEKEVAANTYMLITVRSKRAMIINNVCVHRGSYAGNFINKGTCETVESSNVNTFKENTVTE